MKCVRIQLMLITPSLRRTSSSYVWCETCKVKVDCFSKHKRERPPEPCLRATYNSSGSSWHALLTTSFRIPKDAIKSCETCDVNVKCFVKHREERNARVS